MRLTSKQSQSGYIVNTFWDAISNLPWIVRLTSRSWNPNRRGLPSESPEANNGVQLEEVYVFNPDNGILLLHFSFGKSTQLNPAAVSSMISAIQSFVEDSFGASDSLDSIKCGDQSLLIRKSKQLVLAATTNGRPNGSVNKLLDQAFEKLQREFEDKLVKIDNPSPALQTKLRRRIRSYLSQRRMFAMKIVERPIRVAFASLLSTCLVWGGVAAASHFVQKNGGLGINNPTTVLAFADSNTESTETNEQQQQIQAFISKLDARPSVDAQLTGIDEQGRYIVNGGQDYFDSISPEQFAEQNGLDPKQFDFRFEERFILGEETSARISALRRELPHTLKLSDVQDRRVSLTGRATRRELELAIIKCQRKLPGTRIDHSQLEIH